jgi:hypothetical protein
VSPLLADENQTRETLKIVGHAKSIKKKAGPVNRRRSNPGEKPRFKKDTIIDKLEEKRQAVDFTSNPNNWTAHQVGDWLHQINLSQFIGIFDHMKVGGSWLLRFENKDLKRNKIVFDHNEQRAFDTSLEYLRERHAAAASAAAAAAVPPNAATHEDSPVQLKKLSRKRRMTAQ